MTVQQATVTEWDTATRAGAVLFDDGRRLEVSGESVQVRALRPGQRVALRIAGERVVAVTIATLPFT